MTTTRRQFLGTIGATTALIGAPSILRAQGSDTFRIGALCPYRQSGGVVSVEASADRRSATVSFRSWSAEGAQLARDHVKHAFVAATSAPE